jgi:hypothetical protein
MMAWLEQQQQQRDLKSMRKELQHQHLQAAVVALLQQQQGLQGRLQQMQ